MTVQVGDIYESTDSRRPKRVRVNRVSRRYYKFEPAWASCSIKHPGDSRYRGYTEIRLDRLNPSCHWKRVRKGK